ncbi:MAG: fdrA domain protein [Candidatus Rokubacteria bacterium]|nr:fdrA domain protein [Candidatus Rokubacteria bacterium]
MSVQSLLEQPLRVINVGLEVFAQALEPDGVSVIHVDWQPPAGGEQAAAILARLDDEGDLA